MQSDAKHGARMWRKPAPRPHARTTPTPPLQAGRKLGLDEGALRANAAALEALVPGLAPNLDRMKASDWWAPPTTCTPEGES